MKSVFEKLTHSPEEGFVFKSLRGKGCDCPWHFHPEHELILVLEGVGYRIIGDNVSPLAPGDIVLIGANLPHVYKYDDYSCKPNSPLKQSNVGVAVVLPPQQFLSGDFSTGCYCVSDNQCREQ